MEKYTDRKRTFLMLVSTGVPSYWLKSNPAMEENTSAAPTWSRWPIVGDKSSLNSL